MQHHRAILKQVGFVLLAVASLDFAYGIYSISQARTYQFNGIVIALAGIALMRGSLGAARIVRWVAAFGISSIIATLLVMHPLLTPAELRAIEFNLYPNRVISWYVTQIAQLALCYFAYRRLSAIALSSTRKKRNTTKLAFILGVGLTVLMTGIIHFTVNSGAGIKAVELARQQYGENYKYHVVGLSWTNGNASANLTAYNETEIKPVRVNWKD